MGVEERLLLRNICGNTGTIIIFFIQRKKKIEFNFQHQILKNYQS